MVKTLIRHGNSYALVIDRPILDLLKIEPETPLEIETDGNTLMVVPVRDKARRERFEKALAKVNRRYGRALKRLAE
jgi:antitoxin component of MazEF toxin-antitoxin module